MPIIGDTITHNGRILTVTMIVCADTVNPSIRLTDGVTAVWVRLAELFA